MWIDTHCHLQDERFKNELPDVLARAKHANVNTMVVATSNVSDSKVAVELALKHDLYCTVGIHPHDARSFDNGSTEELENIIRQANKRASEKGRDDVVVAVGEIGLDYHYDYSPRDTQRGVFLEQIRFAKKLNLPIVIHVREAFQDFLQVIEQAKNEELFLPEYPGVIHCYSGSAEFAKRLLPYNFLFGFDGPLTFTNARTSRQVVDMLSSDRLLVETDAPYLTPVPYRGKRNEPANIPLIGAKMAEIKDMTREEMAAITTKNARRLFRLQEK